MLKSCSWPDWSVGRLRPIAWAVWCEERVACEEELVVVVVVIVPRPLSMDSLKELMGLKEVVGRRLVGRDG